MNKQLVLKLLETDAMIKENSISAIQLEKNSQSLLS